MSKGKYDVILDSMVATETRLEILFRQAGDGFLQVEYGREQRAALQDSFRMLAINDIIISARPCDCPWHSGRSIRMATARTRTGLLFSPL